MNSAPGAAKPGGSLSGHRTGWVSCGGATMRPRRHVRGNRLARAENGRGQRLVVRVMLNGAPRGERPERLQCTFYQQHRISSLPAMTVAVQGSTSVLGKRLAQDMTTHFEDALTEYYRQECLRSLYKTAKPRILTPRAAPEPIKRKRVTLSLVPQIIGSADPLVDRSPIEVTPISQIEMVMLLSQRTFPAQS